MAIATVTSITGEAYARDENGNLRELSVGDTLEEGEVLVTSDNGRVELDFGDGIAPTVIEGGEQIAMTPDLDANQPVDAEDASAADEDLDALLAELDEGEGDLLENLEATAAGAGGGGGAIGGGHGFVRLARIAEDTDPLAFNFAGASLEQTPEVQGEDLEPEVAAAVEQDDTSTDMEPDPELPPEVVNATLLSLESSTVVEGNNIVFAVTTSVAPSGSPLQITLSNGSVVTIAVGETTGSVVLDSREDDVYLQGDDTTTITIVSTSGGGFDEIALGESANVTVVDDKDATTIELFIPQMLPLEQYEQSEQYQQDVQPYPGNILLQPQSGIPEGTEVTVGARVENAPQETDLVITLSNGELITIAVGDTEGTTTFALPNVPEGGDTLALTIESVTGGNYEAVDFGDALAEFDIRDSVPSAGQASALVDDDGLISGNQGGTGDNQGQGDNEATFSGILGLNYGGDGAGTIDFSVMDQQTADLSQEEVIYSWDEISSTLTATVNSGDREGTNLFTVTIDDTDTGDYTVELLNNILHSEGNDENNEFANLTYTVTDADGSEALGSLDINFDDDTPVASDVTANTLTEDGNTTEVSGNVFADGDAAYGADGAGSLAWGTAPQGLSDYGTLTTNSDGSWSFTLDNSLAAVQALGADDTRAFELGYTVTDADGDQSSGKVALTLIGSNDAPEVSVEINDQTSGDAESISPLDVSGNFDDVDNEDTLTFTAEGLPEGLSIDDNTGIISGSIDNSASQGGDDGIYDVTVTATDEEGASTSDTFQWTVTNPAPDAVDDRGEVDFGDTLSVASDGVLGNDSDPDGDALSVSEVEGDQNNVGQEVDGKFGTLTLNSDGSYDYVSDQPQPVLYGYQQGDGALGNNESNLLTAFSLDTAAMQRVQATDGKGVGVAGSVNREVPEQINDNGEVMIADMGDTIGGAGFSFGVANLFNNENGGESGAWHTYDQDGELVSSGEFGPDNVDYESGSNNVGRINVSAEDAGDFRYIAFEGLAYQNSQGNVEGDGGDYFLTDITLQESFEYTLSDGEGGEDTATLTVDSVSQLDGYVPPLSVDDAFALVDDDGLLDGNPGGPEDRLGQGDDESTYSGQVVVTGATSLSLEGMGGETAEVGQEKVKFSWDDESGTLTAKITDTPDDRDGDLFTVRLDNDGSYTVTLLQNVLHPPRENSERFDDAENDVRLDLTFTASDGDSQVDGSMKIVFNDDTPTLDGDTVYAVAQDSGSQVLEGSFYLTGLGTKDVHDFDGFKVTARGFGNNGNLNLEATDVDSSSKGMGVHSGGKKDTFDDEVDYREERNGNSTKGASEELVVTLDDGEVAYGLNADFAQFYGNEVGGESGVAVFYLNGQKVDSQSFKSNAASGDYTYSFGAIEGGFDKVVFKATDNGNNSVQDNSDFSLKGLTFTQQASVVGTVAGTASISYGADGPSTLNALTVALENQGYELTESEEGIFTGAQDGQNLFTLSLQEGYDGQVDWTFEQLAAMENDIVLSLIATDADGDETSHTFTVQTLRGLTDEPTPEPEVPDTTDIVSSVTAHTVGNSNSGTMASAQALKATNHNSASVTETDGYYAVDHSGNNDNPEAIEFREALLLELGQPANGMNLAYQGELNGATYHLYRPDGIRFDQGNVEDLINDEGNLSIDLGAEGQTIGYVAILGGSSGPGNSGDESSLAVKPLGLTLYGGDDDNSLAGSDGDDTLYGGAGDDELAGGAGADTFVWNFGDNGDQGYTGAPAEDNVMDFNLNEDDEGDLLRFNDLLQGDDTVEDDIDNYIFAAEDDEGDTVLHVSTDGNIGTDGENADQKVNLKDVSMGGANSSDFIQSLISEGKLDIE